MREAAGELLGKLIDHNNVLHIKSLANTFSCQAVETRAHNFILERFEMVCKSEEFLKLGATEVEQYLGLDDIIVRCRTLKLTTKSKQSIGPLALIWFGLASLALLSQVGRVDIRGYRAMDLSRRDEATGRVRAAGGLCAVRPVAGPLHPEPGVAAPAGGRQPRL